MHMATVLLSIIISFLQRNFCLNGYGHLVRVIIVTTHDILYTSILFLQATKHKQAIFIKKSFLPCQITSKNKLFHYSEASKGLHLSLAFYQSSNPIRLFMHFSQFAGIVSPVVFHRKFLRALSLIHNVRHQAQIPFNQNISCFQISFPG